MSEPVIINEKVVPDRTIEVMIPECCREGWDSCPHIVQREKPKKSNIGL